MARNSRTAIALLLTLLVAACGGAPTHFRAPPPQYYQPEPGALPWTITGELSGSNIDVISGSDELVTIRINDEIAAVGGFVMARGQGEANFIGAYRGQRITVHCVTPEAKIVDCELNLGPRRMATLIFAAQE